MINQIQQSRTRLLQQLFKNNFFKVIERVEDFFFPPLCVICDATRTNSPWFCPDCLQFILENNHLRDRCPRCSQNRKFRTCACELVWEYPFESIYSFIDYNEKVQKIMHHIKYFNKKGLAFYMGALLSENTPDSVFNNSDLVIPVPLHWSRKFKRGYNQAEWFARGIVSRQKHLRLFPSALVRKKRTKTQVKLHKEDRARNVKSVFTVPFTAADNIKGRSILLIDDVITTGATTASCANALLSAGCKSVRVLSLARD